MDSKKELEQKKIFNENIGQFYKYSRTLFRWFGLWALPPETKRSTKILKSMQSICIFCFWFLLYDFMLVLNVIVNINDLQLVMSVFLVSSTYVSCLAKFINVRIANKMFKKVTEEMKNEDFRPKETIVGEEQIFYEALKENQKIKHVYTALTLVSFVTFALSALIKGGRSLPCNAHPILDMQKVENYILIFIYQVVGQGCHCITNIAFDCLFCSFFIYIACQLKMFENKLKNIEGSTDEIVHDKLKMLVNLHCRIFSLTEMVQECVMCQLAMQIISSTVVIMTIFFKLAKVCSLKLGNIHIKS